MASRLHLIVFLFSRIGPLAILFSRRCLFLALEVLLHRNFRLIKSLPHHRDHHLHSLRLQLDAENARFALEEAPCGDRAHDRTLTKRMLYQLS